jgi:hypothetical protein
MFMAQNNPTQSDNSRLFYHLKTIGTVALVVGGLSFAALLLLLAFLSDNTGSSYLDIVKSGSITRKSLGPGMLLAGLFLVGATAAITWLISLYASFRIAGPLFRFSRNMELLIGSEDVTLTPIRKEDQLQGEARQLVQSFDLLQTHYREIGAAADDALTLIDTGGHGLAEALAKLRELDRRVHL